MKITKLIDNNTEPNNLIKFTFTHTDDKGTYTHNIDISDVLVKMRCGDRKVNKYIKHLSEVVTPQHLYHIDIPNMLNELAKVYAYRWHTLLYTESLYYNPLFNVDGVEVTTTELGLRKTTDNYGELVNTSDYAKDKTTNTIGETNGTNTHKTNPFNDSSNSYTTDIDESKLNEKTDTIERDAKKDTFTSEEHTDTHTTNSVTDKVTYTRQGNIGVTKSQELIQATVDLDFNVTWLILDDIMENITRGY